MTDTKRVVVTGATGLVGKALCSRLKDSGYEVVVFSRDPDKARTIVPDMAEYVAWTPSEQGDWKTEVDGVYGVVHLAGAPIFGKRWSESYKEEIRSSRVVGTRGLVNAMSAANSKPSVFVCGSAIGWYGPRDDTILDESATPGADFLAHVCIEWEQEGAKAEEEHIRTVLLRTGIVLNKKEGALAQMTLPFRFFSGGPILPGSQWFSWIHVEDEVGIIMLALENEQIRGPLNATAPEPQTNRDFSETLGKVMGSPSWLPVPGFMLRVVLGEVSDILSKGQRVVPKKAVDIGYTFQYETSEEALQDLLDAPKQA